MRGYTASEGRLHVFCRTLARLARDTCTAQKAGKCGPEGRIPLVENKEWNIDNETRIN